MDDRPDVRWAILLFALALLPATACGQEKKSEREEADATAREPAHRSGPAGRQAAVPTDDHGDAMPRPTVTITTSAGDIRIELLPEDAPRSAENFLAYVEDDFYDGLVFHRVIPGFMIQAGGHYPDMSAKEPTRAPIRNESDNGLRNLRGTVAMARVRDPHSARAQFYVNLVDNANLDHRGTDGGWGYAVFGRVIEGMDVVDDIARRPTGDRAGLQNVPVEPVVIEAVARGEDVEP